MFKKNDNDFLGHPKGLYVLFLLELWERFSFYGIKALLIFFLTQHFLLTDDKALHLFGVFFATTFALPVVGGIFADKIIGAKKAVLWGSIFLIIGQTILALSATNHDIFSVSAEESTNSLLSLMFLGLSFISVGIGFVKPNSTTMVGMLYKSNDSRRDSGFTIFYVGISIGAASAAIICGYLGQTYGWQYGFGMAAFGMTIGLSVYLKGSSYLEDVGNLPLSYNGRGLARLKPYSYLVVLLISIFILFHHNQFVGYILLLTGAIIVSFFIYYCTNIEKVERHRIMAIFILIFFLIVFFSLLEQMGGALNLFTERYVNRNFGNFHIESSQFMALNPIFILILGPVLGWFWAKLAKRQIEPSTPAKFSLALVLAGSGLLTLSFSSNFNNNTTINPLWIIGTYFLLSSGELFIAPIALSMITKLSPARICGLMMGTMFLATAIAGFLAAQIARVFTLPLSTSNTKQSMIDGYFDLFSNLGITALVLAGVLLALTPAIKRLMHGVK